MVNRLTSDHVNAHILGVWLEFRRRYLEAVHLRQAKPRGFEVEAAKVKRMLTREHGTWHITRRWLEEYQEHARTTGGLRVDETELPEGCVITALPPQEERGAWGAPGDPPCKHWRNRFPGRVPPPVERLWEACAASWALRYPYLSGERECECPSCKPRDPARVHVSHWTEQVYDMPAMESWDDG